MSIELNRQFVEVAEDKETDPDMVARFGRLTGGALGWNELLARRRVVLLAEAGSGKTTEMKARAKQQAQAGEYSFYASVEDVGRHGFRQSLRPADRKLLDEWRASERDGWLFIDSVDEAKQTGVRLKTALGAIADAIAGAERRAHLVISGRYSDWEFRRDLADLKEDLSIPADEKLPTPPTPDELIINTIHHNRTTTSDPPEEPIVVVMAALDQERVRQFAAGKNVDSLDTFLAKLESAGLWQFARRPLDLDWLVQFWHNNKRLGALAEMLEICIQERLQETNIDRARQDSLDAERAYHALERIGAAMVFARRDTVAVLDPEIDLTDHPSLLDLSDVLPDWSPQDRERLLTRAAFDPATLGRVRIHNDNQGVVRSFLTARWLRRLRQENLSQEDLFDLLFGNEYGVLVIKPSMQTVAGWLSIWDQAVAREVAHCEPFLLLDTGDPASLSLETRECVLTRAVERIAKGDYVPILDGDNLKRFAGPDLGPVVRRLWDKHASDLDIRRLLLRIIWLGEIVHCADIAAKAAIDLSTDRGEAVFAGRALAATADSATKDRYARFVIDNAPQLPSTILWDAAEDLFPRHISVDDLLVIVSKIDIAASDGGLGFDWHGPKLVARITSRADLERLLLGLLAQLDGPVAADDREATPREKAYFPAIAAGAERLLELSQLDEAPPAAITAAIRLGRSTRRSRVARDRAPDVVARLEESAARRRLAFWAFAEQLAGHPMLGGRPIGSLWDLQMLGWTAKLTVDDVEWLLSDAPARVEANERELAINTALAILRDAGWPNGSQRRVRAVAKSDLVMTKAVDSWFDPLNKSAARIESERRHEAVVSKNAIERAKQDQSWITFAAELRADPSKMRNLRPTTSETCDPKLYDLYRLLSQATDERHYAISSVAALEPMIGPDAAEGFRLGLIAHWRAWSPWLRSNRKASEQNQGRWFDSMGLAGITFERAANPNWAFSLTDDDVSRAAEYATLELNGFPSWLVELAGAKPDIVRGVLLKEIRAELAAPADAPWLGKLQDLAHGHRALAALIAPALLIELENRPELPTSILSNMIDVVVCGLDSDHDRLRTLLTKRFEEETAPERSRLYIAALFSIDGSAGTDAVFRKLNRLKSADQPLFVQRILPRIFDSMLGDSPRIAALSLPELVRLVKLAFATIRIEDDNRHVSGVMFSPNERDDAERARSAVFSRLLETPGRAAFNEILKLKDVPGFPIPESRLRHSAKERAGKDSEFAAWKPSDVIEFERTAQTEPQTTRELQLVALRRISDMQYDLINDDFQQGKTLARLPQERDVQNFVADRLRLKQGRSYSVEREVHVADEKEPDVRFRAKRTDASVPLEVKVAESWTMEELEDALKTQLCKKYLRARDARHGILLLVYQRPKPRGWTDQNGKRLKFPEVIARLKRLAVKIAGSAIDAPQPEIALLDMTSFSAKPSTAKKVKRTSPKSTIAISAKRKSAKSKSKKRSARGTSEKRSRKRARSARKA
jgi:hypothetical protein